MSAGKPALYKRFFTGYGMNLKTELEILDRITEAGQNQMVLRCPKRDLLLAQVLIHLSAI